jgi:hypothetical protein
MQKRIDDNEQQTFEMTARALIVMSYTIATLDENVKDMKMQFRALSERHGVEPAILLPSPSTSG